MLVAVLVVADTPAGAVGGRPSTHGFAEPVRDARVELFPAASRALTSKTYAVPHARPDTVVGL